MPSHPAKSREDDGGCLGAPEPRQLDRCFFFPPNLSSQFSFLIHKNHLFIFGLQLQQKQIRPLIYPYLVSTDEPDGLQVHEVVGEGGPAQHAGDPVRARPRRLPAQRRRQVHHRRFLHPRMRCLPRPPPQGRKIVNLRRWYLALARHYSLSTTVISRRRCYVTD
jgi:hypothetical protein